MDSSVFPAAKKVLSAFQLSNGTKENFFFTKLSNPGKEFVVHFFAFTCFKHCFYFQMMQCVNIPFKIVPETQTHLFWEVS